MANRTITAVPANQRGDRLSLATKLAYGAGDLSPAIATILVSFFQLFFLVIVAGLSPGLAGLILAIARVWDAVTDPVMGIITDRTRSRFGRRRPWLLFGAVPFGLVFALLWIVPPFGPTATFIYYLAMVLLFGTATTIVGVPYTALTPELSRDYNERTSLNSFRFAFSIGGSLLGLILHQSIVQAFADQQTGYAVAGGVIGLLCVPPFLWCFLGVRERYHEQVGTASGMSMFRQIGTVFGNRPYLYVIGIYLCSWLAVQVTAAVLPFYITFWLQRNDLQLPMIAAIQGSALLFLFVWSYICARVGKRVTYFMGMIFWIGVQFFLFFLQPGQIVLAFVLAVLAGVGVATAYLIPWSMMPDVMEFDELQTGRRREGVFYGFMVFAQKLGIGLGLFLVGAILDAQGFQSPQPGQDAASLTQPASALFAIRAIIGPVPAVMLILGMLFAWRYPITREKHAEIEAQLAARAQGEEENRQQ